MRRIRVPLALVVALVVAVPLTAVAAQRFKDVPASSTFNADINWMADIGVTKGCNPPTNDEFCPDDPVTRAQMAAFMHRLANTQVSHTIILDQTAFFPAGQGSQVNWTDYDYAAAGAYGRSGSTFMLASVPVPDGATITSFSVLWCNSPTTVTLERRPDSAFDGYGEVLGSAVSTTGDCNVWLTDDTIANGTVDASKYSYFLKVGTAFIRRATVTYTEPLIPS